MKHSILIITVLLAVAAILLSSCARARAKIGPFEYVRAGESYLDKKKFREAVKSFEKAYHVLPENDRVKMSLVIGYTLYASRLLEDDKVDDAIAVLEKAYKVKKNRYTTAGNLAGAYVRKASDLVSGKDYADALDYLRKAHVISGLTRRLKKRLVRTLSARASEAFHKGALQSAALYLIEASRLLKDKNILESLGEVYYHRSNFDLALHYWSKAKQESEEDDPELDKKIEKARKERAIAASSSSFELANFVITAERGLSLTMSEVSSALEEAYTAVGGDFDFYLPKKTEVALYSKRTFRDLFKRPAYIAAFYDGKIRLPVYQPGLLSAHIRRFMFHEYTHALISALTNNNCPVWFEEGLATYEESRIAKVTTDDFKKIFIKKGKFTFSDFNEAFTNEEMNPSVYYQGSYTVVAFIIDRWGLAKLNRILRRLQDGRHLLNAFEDELPLGIAELERQWRMYVSRLFSKEA